MKNTCCYNCNKRALGCHSVCADYKEYREEIDKINAKKDEYRLIRFVEHRNFYRKCNAF